MFGYIKPFKPQLRMCEYDVYRAFYCGLCKILGRHFGLAARMTLNYDFAFLGLLEYAMNDEKCSVNNQNCIAHPFKKTPCLSCGNETLHFTACCSCILVYNKFLDDLKDGNIFRKAFSGIMLLIMKHSYKKASAFYPELSSYISEQMNRQFILEKEECRSIDRASDPSSSILAEMASYLSDDKEQQTLLRRFGYLLGRYIYIADAYDDIEKDFKKGGFNPLIFENNTVNELNTEQIKKIAENSINFTLGALSDVYVQLNIKRFKPILDNIIYMGLKNNFYRIANNKKPSKGNKQ